MADIELLEGEEWRPVVGYEGQYEVSNMGRVRSLDRTIMRKNGHPQTIHGKILHPSHASKGARDRSSIHYVNVGLNNVKSKRKPWVHTLVAEAFLGPRPPGHDVMHINGIRDDNRLSNLKYGSRSENNISMYDYGKKSGSGKLFPEDVLAIRKRLAMNEPGPSIAKDYGVHFCTIYRIKNGQTFGWLKEGEDFAT